MKTSQLITRTLLTITLLIATSIIAQAQSVVYVTANRGTDLNTCTRTSPCRTITKGIATVAAGGTVEILDTGDYAPFTVDKSVVVEASPGSNAVIVTTSGDGITVTTTAATDRVVLSGLTIKGQAGTASGIRVNAQLASLSIENCVVTDFAGDASTSDAGINLLVAGKYFITDTLVRNNSGYGINFTAAAGTIDGTVEHCRIENNGSNGLALQNNATVIARDSVASGNSGSGFLAINATVDLSVENCLSTRNFYGVISAVSATAHVSRSTLVKNMNQGLYNNGGTLRSSGNNITDGNGLGPTFGTITAENIN